MISEAFTVVYNKALDLVSRREHSRHELMQKLDKRFPETMPIIEEALDKLIANKILDSNRVKRDILTAYKYGLKSLYYIRSKDKSNISETILEEGCESGACEV